MSVDGRMDEVRDIALEYMTATDAVAHSNTMWDAVWDVFENLVMEETADYVCDGSDDEDEFDYDDEECDEEVRLELPRQFETTVFQDDEYNQANKEYSTLRKRLTDLMCQIKDRYADCWRVGDELPKRVEKIDVIFMPRKDGSKWYYWIDEEGQEQQGDQDPKEKADEYKGAAKEESSLIKGGDGVLLERSSYTGNPAEFDELRKAQDNSMFDHARQFYNKKAAVDRYFTTKEEFEAADALRKSVQAHATVLWRDAQEAGKLSLRARRTKKELQAASDRKVDLDAKRAEAMERLAKRFAQK